MSINIGDILTVRYRGEWHKAFVVSIGSDGRYFDARFFDDSLPDMSLAYSRFQTIQQRGWVLDSEPNTCQG